MTYDELLEEIELHGIDVVEMDIGKHKGLYADNIIALSKNIKTFKEKTCILAEELGHHLKTHGEIIGNKSISKVKQERIARNWGYEKLVGIIDLVNAFNAGVHGRYEIAQYLNVTEEFLQAAIEYYKQKYGTYFEIDTYVIYFEPHLGIMKKF
ncbi:ImmA/IrrE family metallo-endopeptidase [Clostridium sp. WILCCON 0269]|uniref:ImmA/IrrE family metallo-endopeptidase n=1 Tax=Candidatus Clostridium eludens TaxID=3381663 RepID=A0ABW8SQS9_9CLOT